MKTKKQIHLFRCTVYSLLILFNSQLKIDITGNTEGIHSQKYNSNRIGDD